MGLNEALDDGKTKPGPPRLGGIEGLGESRQDLGRDRLTARWPNTSPALSIKGTAR